MSNAKTFGNLFAAVAVIALASAGILLWLSPRNVPIANAQEVVRQACQHIQEVDSFDFTAHISGSLDGEAWRSTWTWSGRVSGDDYHTTSVSSNGRTYEFIRVGGQGYMRDSAYPNGNAWEPIDGLNDIHTSLDDLGVNPFCPATAGLTRVDRDTQGGGSVTRYSDIAVADAAAFADVPASFSGQKEASNHEYWVDYQGRLVRYREEVYHVEQYDSGGKGVTRTTINSTFSGIGEPNTITSPVISSQ